MGPGSRGRACNRTEKNTILCVRGQSHLAMQARPSSNYPTCRSWWAVVNSRGRHLGIAQPVQIRLYSRPVPGACNEGTLHSPQFADGKFRTSSFERASRIAQHNRDSAYSRVEQYPSFVNFCLFQVIHSRRLTKNAYKRVVAVTYSIHVIPTHSHLRLSSGPGWFRALRRA